MNITIPVPYKVSNNSYYNGKLHWSKKNKIKDIYHEAFWEFKNKYKVEEYPVAVTFIFRFKTRMLDIDNLGIMEKMCIDGLRHIDVLEEDTPKHINELHTFIEKGDKDEIEIIIT